MCDAFSAANAGLQIMGGNIEARGIKADANFEAAQLQLGAFMVAARSNEGETQVLKSYAEQAEANMAAMAVSGASNLSFASIEEGNQADANENIGKLRSAGRWESMQMMQEGKMIKVAGVHAAKAARLKGYMAAFKTLSGAESAYQEYKTGTVNKDGSTSDDFLSRGGSFLRSVGYKG